MTGTADKVFMTVEEVATLLRKKPAWVRAHSNGHRQPTLPSIKPGKERVYRQEAVLQFMLEQEKLTAAKLKRR